MPTVSERAAVAAAFADAQRSAATHGRAGRVLGALLERDEPAFLEAFLQAVNRALVVFAREPAVERIIAFVATFVAGRAADQIDHGHGSGSLRSTNFSSLVLQYLADHTSAVSKAVRFRTCQTIAATLQALPEDAALDEELWEPLQIALLARAADRIPRVRAAAAAALCRLQTSGDPVDDPVAAALLAMLSSDSSSAVRRAALASIAASNATLPVILRRIRDVKEDVRRAAFATIAAKVHPEDLEIDTRIEVLGTGLKDRAASVRQVCSDMLLIGSWFGGACEKNVFELVELLGGARYEQEILRALHAVFASGDGESLLKAIQIDINNLTAADVLLLRAMCEIENGLRRLEEIIPGTSVYAEVLKYYSVDEFASRNLLAICGRVDLSDEHGRRTLEDVLRRFFLSSREVADAVIPHAVSAMRCTMLSEETASRILVEIVLQDVLGDSKHPENQKLDMPPVEIKDLDTDEESWSSSRALSILKELFRHAGTGRSGADSKNAMYLPAIQQAVIPLLASMDSQLRQDALECLALFCLLDGSGEQAKRHLPLFVQACRNDNSDIQVLAIKALTDISMMFDLERQDVKKESSDLQSAASFRDADLGEIALSDDDSSEDFYSANGSPNNMPKAVTSSVLDEPKPKDTLEQVVALLDEYITHADETLRAVAAEGLARLLFSKRVAPSPKLLTRLILVYFNPINEDCDPLRQSLSVFFPAFAFSGPQNRVSFEAAFIPALRVLLGAPTKSPLSYVSPLHVAQFMLQLITMGNNDSVPTENVRSPHYETLQGESGAGSSSQQRIATSLLNSIMDSDGEFETEMCRLYAQVLTSLRFDGAAEDGTNICRMQKHVRSAKAHVQDKRTIALLCRFEGHIASLAL